MRYFLIITSTAISLFTSIAFAGGSGGGAVLPGAMVAWDMPEIVRHIGEQDGLVFFQYGQRKGNQWIVEDVAIPNHELKLDRPAFRAIEQSKYIGDWWGIVNY